MDSGEVRRAIVAQGAVRSVADEPGFEGEEMDRFLNRQRRLSVHEVSLVDLLAIARLTGLLPARRALIGIEPQSLDWGDAPTAPVAHAIAHAGAAALELIARWRGHT